MLPNEAGAGTCKFGGLAYLGCGGGGCRAWVRRFDPTKLWAHELGHLTGLHHASLDPNDDNVIDDEYGDFSCPMGSDPSWRRYHAVHRYQNGWLTAGNVLLANVSAATAMDAETAQQNVTLQSASVVKSGVCMGVCVAARHGGTSRVAVVVADKWVWCDVAGGPGIALVRIEGASPVRTYWLSYRTTPVDVDSYDQVGPHTRLYKSVSVH
jgi:hypothetical protein